MKPLFLPLFLFIGLLLVEAQTLCTNGLAGNYPCNDYDLQSTVSISTLAGTSNAEGSDIWGWTDPTTQREYALVAMTNSTAFVDITNPVTPVFLGRLNSQSGISNVWRDVKVYNNYAFIVGDNVGNHGMQVFDLTRLRGVSTPQIFTTDAVFNGVTSCHNIVINEANGYAYLVGCNTYSGGVHFVNISNPTNPTDAGGYSADGYTHDAQVVTYNGPDTNYLGREIYIGSNEDKVVILDVTNKNNVVKISEVFYPQTRYTHQGWFTQDQRYFIVGDELDELELGMNTRTLIFDFSDLDNPTLHTTFLGNTQAIDHNGYVNGNFYYLANYTRGFRVFDISNIGSTTNPMTEIGSFDTYLENDGTSFNGAWSVYPYFTSGNIIVSDINRGLFVLKQSSTVSTNAASTFKTSIFPNPVNSQNLLSIKSQQEFQSVKVRNPLGSEVMSFQISPQKEFQIPINHLTKGVYFIQLDNSSFSKFIVN